MQCDRNNKPFRPCHIAFLGRGNTKVYGAALIRMRDRDFEAVTHKGGISPEWCVKYQDFEPYYIRTEKLYDVHGLQGEDPIEPHRSFRAKLHSRKSSQCF